MKADEFSANRRPWLSAVGAFSEGADSPLAFLDRCLRNIEEREDDVRAFACLALDSARAAAAASTRRWREGTPLSILDGMPIGIKDIIETIDLPTGNGSPLFAGWRSGRDAASVKALREAGAVILGKTVTTEFAATSPGETRNPWDLTRTPGGSSSGSAAGVAAGFFSAALGSQVVGSILRPASYCGCYGYKPSVGAINRGGSFDYMSQSCTGVIAASLEDCWQMAFEIVQRAGGDPGFPGLVGPVQAPEPVLPSDLILLQTAGWKLASPQAKAALETALLQLTRAGVRILSRASHAAVDCLESLILEAVPLTRSINTWESRWPLNTYRDRGAGGLSAPMLQRLRQAEDMTPHQYRGWIGRRDEIRETYREMSGLAAACITLCAPDCAPVGIASTGDPIFAVPSSFLGVPALSLPLLAATNLPLGLQLMGFNGQDASLFAIAAAVRDTLGAG